MVSTMTRPDRVFLRKLRRLDPRLNAHFDTEKCRWIITQDVKEERVEYDEEGLAITRVVVRPDHVMTVQSPLYKSYRPLDDRVIDDLALCCDIQKLFRRGADAVDAIMEKKRQMRERIKKDAREEWDYWVRHEWAMMKGAFEKGSFGQWNEDPVEFVPKAFSYPTEGVPCFSGMQEINESNKWQTVDNTPSSQTSELKTSETK